MKKTAIVLLICMFFQGNTVFAENQTLNLKIDENTEVNTVKREMFGFNYEWGDDANTGFYVSDDTSENENFYKELAGYPFVNNRGAGVSSGSFLWKYTLGSLNRRTAYDDSFTPSSRKYGGKPQKHICGLTDWLIGLKGVDNTARFDYVVNVLKDSMENVADVVEFMRGDGTINYNGGINWAKVRKECGIDEPVDIFAWEIGNELDLRGVTIDEYIEKAKQAISAIRSVDKTTPIAVHIASNDRNSVGSDWQRRLLIELGDWVDYIVVHKYYGYKAVSGAMESTVINLIDDIDRFGDSNRLKIIITEHASGWVEGIDNWPKNHSIAGMLNEMDFFSRMLQYPQVVSANYHGFRTGPWNMCYKDSDGVIKPTILLDLYKIFVDNASEKTVIKTELDGFSLGSTTDVPGFAVKDENGDITVFIASFKTEDTDISIEADNEYVLTSETTIQGNGDLYANNYIDRKEIAIKTTEFDSDEVCKGYTLKPLSFAMLKLKKK